MLKVVFKATMRELRLPTTPVEGIEPFDTSEHTIYTDEEPAFQLLFRQPSLSSAADAYGVGERKELVENGSSAAASGTFDKGTRATVREPWRRRSWEFGIRGPTP